MRKQQYDVVVVGAGIVGVSVAWELAKRGVTDVLVVDRGPLFRTGGSTSHAPGGVFQNNASKTVSTLAQWSVATYLELDAAGPERAYYGVGGLEVATTPERWADLHRKYGWARSWGLDAHLLSPAETVALSPLIDPKTILGSIHVERDGIARAVRLVERIAARAEALGVDFLGETRVTGFDLAGGEVRAVETSRGRVACGRVVLCGGIWGPLLGKMAGVALPLQPCAHAYVRTTPVPELRGLEGVVTPLWRHQDASMYFWQEGERYGIGSYRHEPVIVDPEQIDDSRPAPADLDFDPAVMAFGRQEAGRLVPALAGIGTTDTVYGMFSFTPDAMSLVGEVAAVRGLWAAEAVWVTHGAGTGRLVAEMMVEGGTDLDTREIDVNRFAPHVPARSFVRERGAQQYREVYDIIHPRMTISRPRGLRRAPWYGQQQALGAAFIEHNGWERAQWYEANAALPVSVAGSERRRAWMAAYWSPIAGAEHVATRTAAGLFDMSTFTKIDVTGPGALAALQQVSCTEQDRPVGRATYSLLLNERGGIESDVVVARLGAESFRVFSGAGSGPRDLAWLQRATRDMPGVRLDDVTSAGCALGLWGPRAAGILRPLAEPAGVLEAFPRFGVRDAWIGMIPCRLIRMSYVGEEGWEIHAPVEYGAALWETLMAAGAPLGLVAAGGAAVDTLRLEVGMRGLGTDLRAELTPAEAGVGFAVAAGKTGYTGWSALQTRPARRRIATLALDDATEVAAGKEPVLDAAGRIVGYATGGGFGYTLGRSLVVASLEADAATPGARLAVEIFGERVPATVLAEPALAPAWRR